MSEMERCWDAAPLDQYIHQQKEHTLFHTLFRLCTLEDLRKDPKLINLHQGYHTSARVTENYAQAVLF